MNLKPENTHPSEFDLLVLSLKFDECPKFTVFRLRCLFIVVVWLILSALVSLVSLSMQLHNVREVHNVWSSICCVWRLHSSCYFVVLFKKMNWIFFVSLGFSNRKVGSLFPRGKPAALEFLWVPSLINPLPLVEFVKNFAGTKFFAAVGSVHMSFAHGTSVFARLKD